ncbi:choice-of-anchor I family protein [Streptomyces sp. TRM66268-LWL]|uniref:Choice-of-anchor I family protein n=1 Tax=Streptomyces polyasparticus TaxID=2767826 RepID=A0ABR7SA16_9ACTN|nr:choice-of-anchor I family protein [Streptomyces polyasparticus]MBC9711462.1 choice-of-anchor I family protein [Streptomyces polyasparticus]
MRISRRAARVSMAALLVSSLTAVAAPATSASPEAATGADRSQAHSRGIELRHLSTFTSQAAEIVAYDRKSRRAFVTGADTLTLDIVDVRDPAHPRRVRTVDLSAYGDGAVTSVAAYDGLIAVAVETADAAARGQVVLMRPDGGVLRAVPAGHGPDMVTFSKDGDTLLVANEGEPSGYAAGDTDPEGSVTLVDLSRGWSRASARTADFRAYNHRRLDPSVRISGPGASVAQDLEPEYITVDKHSRKAYVTLQENNAVATVDLRTARVTGLAGLGHKDHSKPGNGLDTSDKDGAINIATRPLLGVYMPDAAAAFEHHGRTYYVVANEGDAREYGDYEDMTRLADLDPALLPEGFDPALLDPKAMGRLDVLASAPAKPGGPLYAAGGRSFSVRDTEGRLVWDSGDLLEQLTAKIDPANFNAEGEGDFDKRSDNKGPEAEGLTVGEIDGRTYAFVLLERTGGVMTFDITDPRAPRFEGWTRTAGDASPEGVSFVPATASPTREPLLLVANEGSQTTSTYEITRG